MPRLIDANEFRKRIDHYPPDIRDIAKKELRYTPTIDAVEVVRCRDCEFRYESEYRGRRVMMCDYMDPEPEDKMGDDDFCSRGRKKDG